MNRLHFEAAGVAFNKSLCFKNNLTHFVFSNNANWIKAATFEDLLSTSLAINGLDKLASIDISRNDLSLQMELAAKNLHFPNMQDLNMEYNNITLGMHFQVCKQCPLLQQLVLSGNRLGQKPDFPYDLVSGCSQLQELDLSENQFGNPQNALSLNFNDLDNLKIFNLSKNNLNILDEEMRSAIDQAAVRPPELTVDLSHNPLVCDCESLPFMKWVTDHVANHESKVKFHNFEYYECWGSHSILESFKTLTPQQEESACERALCQLTECF